MRLLLIFLIISPIFSFGQLNVKDYGARGDGSVDDYGAIQKAIDIAVKQSGTVYFPQGTYRIDQPIIIHNWNGKEYGQVFIKIIGESTMWDNGKGSTIIANFKDKFALGIQKGKGCIVRGLNIQGLYKAPGLNPKDLYKQTYEDFGDKSCRDSRYSPYAGIVLDPFSGEVPADGGYPGLKNWYRGSQTRGGSSGIRIEDCTFGNLTVGAILSPNGYTQNNDLITFENIRFGDCKAGFVGCQAQEKMNRIINIGAWGSVHTLFVFNKYGAGQPGNYFIQGVNIAGLVINIIHRYSGGWGPMYMSDVFAESLASIGIWDGASGDVLSNALINFRVPPEELDYFPDFHLMSSGLTVKNSNIRYYGQPKIPLLLIDTKQDNNIINVPFITGRYSWLENMPYQLESIFELSKSPVINHSVKVNIRFKDKNGQVKKDDIIIFAKGADKQIVGMGKVQAVNAGQVTIAYISPSIKSLNDHTVLHYIGVKKNNK
ncbi:glycoside hydrolase family 55 protein [Flavihumibacter sediminis]|nr:glycoside hydrolase family 55 protein [Flavihumibacter sediminis]